MGEHATPMPSKPTAPAEMEIRDYIDLLIRRKWWIILPAVAAFVATAVVAFRLPNMYRSQTVILVDPQKVPDSYVPSTVSVTILDRLSTIQEQVTSPTRLKQLIESMNLYPDLRKRMSLEDIIGLMQKSMNIEVVEQGGHSLSAFRIVFTGRNPVEVATIANRLASMFIDENVRVREQQSYGTAEFLESELQKTERQLQEKEAELSAIKAKYVMDLPESKQFHLEALTNLRNQLRDSQERVNRAEQEKVYLHSLMANAKPTIDLDTEGESGSPHEAQRDRLESKLADLRARYGASYPEVRKVQHEIDVLNARIAKEEKNRASDPAAVTSASPAVQGRVRNPVVEAQLQQLDREIERQTKLQESLQQQIKLHMASLEQVPTFEQRIAGMMRDYDTLRSHYTHLLDRKLSADTASALETRQKGERFLILDPAQVPSKPYGPNRLLICLAGLMGGLAGGIGLAVLMEVTDTRVRDEREAARMIGAQVLVVVPVIETRTEKIGKQMQHVMALIGTVVGSVAVGYVVSFLTSKFPWP